MIFARVVYLANGQSVNVTGVSEDGLWLQIEHPTKPGGLCWVIASAIDLQFDPAGLKELAGPELVQKP